MVVVCGLSSVVKFSHSEVVTSNSVVICDATKALLSVIICFLRETNVSWGRNVSESLEARRTLEILINSAVEVTYVTYWYSVCGMVQQYLSQKTPRRNMIQTSTYWWVLIIKNPQKQRHDCIIPTVRGLT